VPGFSFTLEQGRWEELSLKRIALALVLSSALLGLGSVTMAQDSMPTAPNNSAVNVRDRTPDAMTADQQSNTKSDMTTTREIRKAVVKDHSLSILAHNVKIVSVNGKVTLRGPVNTEKEKVAIASKARAIAGRGNVDNQIEVKTQ
jgi:hyperosmotically inducible protein